VLFQAFLLKDYRFLLILFQKNNTTLLSKNFLEHNQESIRAYFQYFNDNLKEKKVLDLGCGTGYDLSKISDRGALVHGIDSSKEMVRLARQNNPNGIIKIGCFNKIPFPGQYFDFVVSKWALQTTADIDPIYEEVDRVLKPGGKLIFLICHPIRQFIEKKKENKNYFKKEIVESIFFNGQITALEPSHTMKEYLSPLFFSHFTLESYEEGFDSAAEMINGDIYPSFFIIKASTRKKIKA
jgi:ubiquinone/menaquinone biosynthesis C-methylase UbiE